MKDIAIIGAGRLGTALGHALARSGYRIKAVSDISLAAARRMARGLGRVRIAGNNIEAGGSARAIFLCVPDSAVAAVARELEKSAIDWRGRVVVHCSGLLDSRPLAPLRRRGALTASAHPVRSFPRRPTADDPFRRVSVGIEGQAGAVAWLNQVMKRLGARPVPLRPGVKPLYHAACSLASNGLVILIDMAQELLVEAGFSPKSARDLLMPLAQGTLHNVNKLGTTAALTGPLVRGDEETVARHLATLERYRRTREAYRALGSRGLDLVKKAGVRSEKIRALRRLLEDR